MVGPSKTFDRVLVQGFGSTPDMAVTRAVMDLLTFFCNHGLTVFQIRELRAVEWHIVVKGEGVVVRMACWLKQPHTVPVKEAVQTGENDDG